MNFLQRLKFYGIGFGLGLLIIYATFGTRSCVSINEYKMQELVFKKFELDDLAKCKLKCLIKNEALLKIELRHFEVNYGLSDVHKKPYGEYFIQPKKEFEQKYNYKLIIVEKDSTSYINDIQITNNTPCNCK
ncbi:MAG: hypothetical protein JSU07_12080 [Bacteroidetes bacterium]|nr:hypothetical protein [Bacteroidota bacterium]